MITVTNVTPGVYDLIVSKSGCLDYTIKNVVVTADGVDLTSHSDPAVKNIALLTGDVDKNGSINVNDLNIVWNSANFNKAVSDAANTLTDIDGNGSVNVNDLNIVWNAANFNKGENDCTAVF